MAVFLPRAETMDSSLAVTLSDWDAHCLRPKGATEAMFCCTSERSICLSAFQERSSERKEGKEKEDVHANKNKTEAKVVCC